MEAYLVGEEGPLSSFIAHLKEGESWSLGRDLDEVTFVLEDPQVSRKHVQITHTAEGYLFENFSSVNPATQNGRIVTEPVLLKEGDILQIGGTFFRFTEKNPQEAEEVALSIDASEDLNAPKLGSDTEGRWLLKVISGPNAGAEFGMAKGRSYTIGKDADQCDILFQDLSVSREHARISIDEQEQVFIEDLKSRNGLLVNGNLTTEKVQIFSQDIIALGTTSILLIDREEARETIFSAPPPPEEKNEEEEVLSKKEMKDWKEIKIPYRHLVFAGSFFIAVVVAISGLFSLFKSEPIPISYKSEEEKLSEVMERYPTVQYSFNANSGKLFLIGNLMTPVDKEELDYSIRNLNFIDHIDNNVVIDEYVWENINAMLSRNPEWQSVYVHSTSPGHYILRGYVTTSEQAEDLKEFINLNFPYLDKLKNDVVVETNLKIEVESQLIEKGFSAVTFQLTGGDLVLAGRVDDERKMTFEELVAQARELHGIRSVKNLVVYTTAVSSRIDLSNRFQVTGESTSEDNARYVVINGKIYTSGEMLDGMTITHIDSSVILLEKDGVQYKINYNVQ